FFGAPCMYRTAAMNVSSKHGSWRRLVMRQRSSYIAYGSRPSRSLGVVIPNWRRSAAMEGPMLGISSRWAISLPPLADFFLFWIIVNFPRRVIALIAASRFNAELWLGWASW